jgi:hypothetical protein
MAHQRWYRFEPQTAAVVTEYPVPPAAQQTHVTHHYYSHTTYIHCEYFHAPL